MASRGPFPFTELIEDVRDLLVDSYLTSSPLDALFFAMTCHSAYARIRSGDPRFKYGLAYKDLLEAIVATGSLVPMERLASFGWDLPRSADIDILARTSLRLGKDDIFNRLKSHSQYNPPEHAQMQFRYSNKSTQSKIIQMSEIAFLFGLRSPLNKWVDTQAIEASPNQYCRGLATVGSISTLGSFFATHKKTATGLFWIALGAFEGGQVEVLKWVQNVQGASFTEGSESHIQKITGTYYVNPHDVLMMCRNSTPSSVYASIKFFLDLGIDLGAFARLYCIELGAIEAFELLESKYSPLVDDANASDSLINLLENGKLTEANSFLDRFPKAFDRDTLFRFRFDFSDAALVNNRMRRGYYSQFLKFYQKVEKLEKVNRGDPSETDLFVTITADDPAAKWNPKYFDPSFIGILELWLRQGSSIYHPLLELLVYLSKQIPQMKDFVEGHPEIFKSPRD